MIGLLFFGAIALWGVIAIALGIKLPKWLGIQRYRVLWSVVLVPLIFFAPVADEIIAYPQMQALCKQDRFFEFSPGMDARKATGRTVYSEERHSSEYIFPSSIKLTKWSTVYVDSVTKEDVLIDRRFVPSQGMLGIPNGSGGGRMTIILKACPQTGEAFDPNGIPRNFSHLNLTKIPKP